MRNISLFAINQPRAVPGNNQKKKVRIKIAVGKGRRRAGARQGRQILEPLNASQYFGDCSSVCSNKTNIRDSM